MHASTLVGLLAVLANICCISNFFKPSHPSITDMLLMWLQAYGAGHFYPGMPGARFVPPQQQPAGHGYAPPAAGGYSSYAPPAAAGQLPIALPV